MNSLALAAILIGGPVYLYFFVRWMTSAIVRSFYEVKFEMERNKGGLKDESSR